MGSEGVMGNERESLHCFPRLLCFCFVFLFSICILKEPPLVLRVRKWDDEGVKG